MKRNILLIVFTFLFLFNYEICNLIYSGGFDKLSIYEWDIHGNEWTSFRYKITAFMYLIAIVSQLLVPNKYSKSIALFVSTLVLFSFIDKAISNITARHLHDIIMIGFALFVGTFNYNYENK